MVVWPRSPESWLVRSPKYHGLQIIPCGINFAPRTHVRCLIIDDDESPRVLMERLVTKAGHRVTGCSSPWQGIQAALQGGYDIAIVDMEMPDMDGAALIGELRRVVPSIRVLVVSGYG